MSPREQALHLGVIGERRQEGLERIACLVGFTKPDLRRRKKLAGLGVARDIREHRAELGGGLLVIAEGVRDGAGEKVAGAVPGRRGQHLLQRALGLGITALAIVQQCGEVAAAGVARGEGAQPRDVLACGFELALRQQHHGMAGESLDVFRCVLQGSGVSRFRGGEVIQRVFEIAEKNPGPRIHGGDAEGGVQMGARSLDILVRNGTVRHAPVGRNVSGILVDYLRIEGAGFLAFAQSHERVGAKAVDARDVFWRSVGTGNHFLQGPGILALLQQRDAQWNADGFLGDAEFLGLSQFLFGVRAQARPHVNLAEQQPCLRVVRIFLDDVLELDDAALEVALVLEILGALNVFLLGQTGRAVAAVDQRGGGEGQGKRESERGSGHGSRLRFE